MLASNSSLSSQAWGGPTDLIFMLVIRNLDEMQRRSVLMTEEVTCLLLLSLEHRVTSLPSKISLFPFYFITFRAFPDDSVVKNQPAMQEIQEMWVWCLGQEDLTGSGNGNPLHYSCLENSMDRGAWRTTVHRVTKSWARLIMHSFLPSWLQKMLWFWKNPPL